jgi:hypothetical protein
LREVVAAVIIGMCFNGCFTYLSIIMEYKLFRRGVYRWLEGKSDTAHMLLGCKVAKSIREQGHRYKYKYLLMLMGLILSIALSVISSTSTTTLLDLDLTDEGENFGTSNHEQRLRLITYLRLNCALLWLTSLY